MKLTLLLISFIFLLGCNETSKQPYNRKDLLRKVGENALVPSFKEFSEKASELSASLSNLSENYNEENLKVCRENWQKASLAWAHCELFNFEPFSDTYIKNKISTWPAKVSTIERKISTPDGEINQSMINSGGSNSKGLKAIEYLLFDESAVKNLKDSKKHMAYLVALGQDLKSQGEEAYRLWSDGNYSFLVFYVSKDYMESGGSIGLTINEMIALIERVYMSKLSKPLGKGEKGHLDVEGFEAWRSKQSLNIILANIEIIEKVYSSGFYDYLDYLGITPDSPLSTRLKNQFKKVKDEIKSIDSSLEEIAVSKPEKLNALLEEVRNLLVLIKVDTANQMGVTVTLNDNDGD